VSFWSAMPSVQKRIRISIIFSCLWLWC
jgi:hypothetical protein